MTLTAMLLLSENWTVWSPYDLRGLVEAARVAEGEGVGAVAVSEHVVLGAGSAATAAKHNPRDFDRPGNQDPATPWPSATALLAAVAVATSRIRVVAGAVIAPLRHPLQAAKDLASLDLLACGRLVVMPTPGWHRAEFDALGVAFHRRGALLDEHLDVWRRAWRDGVVASAGPLYPFDEVHVEPRPTRPEGPPLWIPGASLHPAALRRIAAHGAGWTPGLPVPPPADVARIREALRAAGRDPGALELQGLVRGVLPAGDGTADLARALEIVPTLLEHGVTVATVKPSQYIREPGELRGFCRELVRRLADAGCG